MQNKANYSTVVAQCQHLCKYLKRIEPLALGQELEKMITINCAIISLRLPGGKCGLYRLLRLVVIIPKSIITSFFRM